MELERRATKLSSTIQYKQVDLHHNTTRSCCLQSLGSNSEVVVNSNEIVVNSSETVVNDIITENEEHEKQLKFNKAFDIAKVLAGVMSLQSHDIFVKNLQASKSYFAIL